MNKGHRYALVSAHPGPRSATGGAHPAPVEPEHIYVPYSFIDNSVVIQTKLMESSCLNRLKDCQKKFMVRKSRLISIVSLFDNF